MHEGAMRADVFHIFIDQARRFQGTKMANISVRHENMRVVRCVMYR